MPSFQNLKWKVMKDNGLYAVITCVSGDGLSISNMGLMGLFGLLGTNMGLKSHRHFGL